MPFLDQHALKNWMACYGHFMDIVTFVYKLKQLFVSALWLQQAIGLII